MPYKIKEARRQKFPKARYRVKNWGEYDQALQDRGSLTGWVIPEAIAAWQAPPTGQPGRSPLYSNLAIETGHLLRLAFGRPWRQTEGLLRSIMNLLGVSLAVPDHTTFSWRSLGLSLTTALPPTARGPVHVVIDSTGLKIYGAGEWQREKHGERGRRTWRKLHLAVNPDNGEILASELMTNEVGDLSMVAPLLEQIPESIASVLADGAYDVAPVYRTIAALVHKSDQGQTGELAGFLYRTLCERGIPSWVIRLITEQATQASTFCVANVRARSVGPIRVL
jgi:hypothetical protein